MDLDNIPTKQTVTMGGWNPAPPLEDRPGTVEPTVGALGLCGATTSPEACTGCTADFCCQST